MISTNQNDNQIIILSGSNAKSTTSLLKNKNDNDDELSNKSIQFVANFEDEEYEDEEDEEKELQDLDDEYYNDNNSITTKNNVKMVENENTDVLSWNQIKKLDELLTRSIQIHGRNNMPTLDVTLKEFIRHINKRLIEQRIKVRDVRINGGVASYILADNHDYHYSDIDIIFSCDLLNFNNESSFSSSSNFHYNGLESSFSNCCDVIKQTVLECLLDYMPPNFNKENLTQQCIKESYVTKMAKIYQMINANSNSRSSLAPSPLPDQLISQSPQSSSPSTSLLAAESLESLKSSSRWSLISLFNDQGQNIELKFVDKMKRQFQFSVDSFQIHLSSILSYYDLKNEMTENIYPRVIAESMYGNFKEALNHLNSKLIATISPEEIRGGGLLKYCNLLIRGYKSMYDQTKMQQLEKYMCSRFFIDFSDIKDQEHKLRAYLDSHFCNDPQMCVKYLKKLYQVVNSSTVCLMGHERKQTLSLIESLANSIINSSNNNNSNSNNLFDILNDNDSSSSLSSSSCSNASSTCSSNHFVVNSNSNTSNYNNYNNNSLAINESTNNNYNNNNNKHFKIQNINNNNNNINCKKHHYYSNHHKSSKSYSYGNNNNNSNKYNKSYFYSSGSFNQHQSNHNNCNKSKYYHNKNENNNINNNNDKIIPSSLLLFSSSSISPSPSQSPSPSPSHSSISSISSLYNEESNNNNNNNNLALKANNKFIKQSNSNSNLLTVCQLRRNSPVMSPTNKDSSNNSNNNLIYNQPYLVKYPDNQDDQDNENYENNYSQASQISYPHIEIFENFFSPPSIIPVYSSNNHNNQFYIATSNHPQIYVLATSNSKFYSTVTAAHQPSSTNGNNININNNNNNNVYIKN